MTFAVTEGMSIAITSDPTTKAHARPDVRIFKKRRIETGVLPALAEAFIQFLEGKREHLAHIENHPWGLKSDFRLFQQDFTASPEAFENDLDFIANRCPAGRGETLLMFE